MKIMCKKIQNHEKVVTEYGYWPSFHDAEILQIKFTCDKATGSASVSVRVHAFHMTDTVVNGRYELIKNNIITFVVRRIGRSEISGWNHQNAQMGIRFVETAYGLAMTSESSFGVDMNIEGQDVIVESIMPLQSTQQIDAPDSATHAHPVSRIPPAPAQ